MLDFCGLFFLVVELVTFNLSRGTIIPRYIFPNVNLHWASKAFVMGCACFRK